MTTQDDQAKHEHNFTLAKFTDNSDRGPGTLCPYAASDYKWWGSALFICECGVSKTVLYDDERRE
jgi:hypothetical protein